MVISAGEGAPVAWQPLEPVMSAPIVSMLMKSARNPHAAMLLLDFLFSAEGQKIFADANYIPANPAVKPKDASIRAEEGGFRVNTLTPEILGAQTARWTQTYQQLFVK